jgi:hypothetical protein
MNASRDSGNSIVENHPIRQGPIFRAISFLLRWSIYLVIGFFVLLFGLCLAHFFGLILYYNLVLEADSWIRYASDLRDQVNSLESPLRSWAAFVDDAFEK